MTNFSELHHEPPVDHFSSTGQVNKDSLEAVLLKSFPQHHLKNRFVVEGKVPCVSANGNVLWISVSTLFMYPGVLENKQAREMLSLDPQDLTPAMKEVEEFIRQKLKEMQGK